MTHRSVSQNLPPGKISVLNGIKHTQAVGSVVHLADLPMESPGPVVLGMVSLLAFCSLAAVTGQPVSLRLCQKARQAAKLT